MFSHDLHAYVRALFGSGALRVGPFLVSIDDHDDGPFRNYALPDDHSTPSAAEVAVLIETFHDHGRVPRLEYLPELCPDLEPLLLAAGFSLERRLPVLTCPPDAATAPEPDGITVRLAVSHDDLSTAAEVQNEAYGVSRTTEHDVHRLQSTIERGGLVALAVDNTTGDGVGAGLCAPPHHGVSELAAVGVRASHRRRGIGASLTALLTRSGIRVGITSPFLTPVGEEEERIYRAVGYRASTSMIHISRTRRLTAWTSRPETPADIRAIHDINAAAFPTTMEAELVNALRDDPHAWIGGLSMVTETDTGDLVGYALLSRCHIDGQPALALAPCAVLPEHQRTGAGSAAIRTALDAARFAGENLVVVLGHAEYYPRFGFIPASRFDVRPPFDVPDEAFLALALDPSTPTPAGTVHYPAAFGV